jgi:LPXTG-site transpeptidase (sortase) family protein
MARLTRRRFVLLSSVAVLAAACGSPVERGLRGSGTQLVPHEPDISPTRVPTIEPAVEPTRSVPLLVPVPESDPIVSTDALPGLASGSTDAEMHVLPVISGKPPIAPTLPARRIVIPTLALDSKVIQLGTKLDRKGQVAWETAPFAVGQHKGLAGPGQNGNMVLSGHISSPNEGAIFHRLPELKVGQGVIVATDERQYLYRVIDVQTVTPDQVQVLDQTSDPTATLITCVPDGIYSHRLVVTARLV